VNPVLRKAKNLKKSFIGVFLKKINSLTKVIVSMKRFACKEFLKLPPVQ